ncbi:MAG: hypothetical protein R6X02_33770 [Enhygromyxa sp.]
MTRRNYDLTLLFVLLGFVPACTLADKNLGETDESESGDPDEGSELSDLPGEDDDDSDDNDDNDDNDDENGDGDMDTCGNGIAEEGEVCFTKVSLLAPGPVLDVGIADVDGEEANADVVVLTTNPDAPLAIWRYSVDLEAFVDEPEIVEGPLPTPVVPGMVIGDFDPFGIESPDIAYLSQDGVVIIWDKFHVGFDEVTLAVPCPDPISFTMGGFDELDGADVLCAHDSGDGTIEVLLASGSNVERDFAAPIVVAANLPEISPLFHAVDFSGPQPIRRFIAHDGVDQLLIWTLDGDHYQQTSQAVPAAVVDLNWTSAGLVAASHDPAGLQLLDLSAQGFGITVGELIPSAALPHRVASVELTNDNALDLVATLDSGHLGVWPATDQGFGDPVLVEVGPDPREMGIGPLGWTGEPVIAVADGDDTVTLLYPNP